MIVSESEFILNQTIFEITYRKRLESVQCRMRYIQSECNTATAMKLCENYILDGDHCVDIVSKCRNMTFKEDKGLLTHEYEDYIHAFNAENISFIDYLSELNKDGRRHFQSLTYIFIYLFVK